MIRTSIRSIITQIDRALYILFSRHVDRTRHNGDRDQYRGTALSVGFDTYVARIYGLSWIGFLVGTVGIYLVVTTLSLGSPAAAVEGILNTVLAEFGTKLQFSDRSTIVGISIGAGTIFKRGLVTFGMTYLGWRTRTRRTAIERSLPGAVRYLRALADGSERHQVMFRKVATQEAYGETSVAFGRVVETATLTGSLDTALRTVARETPSRELLSPFLLKFREHASQGPDSLKEFLRMESRMLSHQRSRARQRAGDYLKLIAEIFIMLLVVPALLVVVTTIGSVLFSGMAQTTWLSSRFTLRSVIMYGSSAFVLAVGGSAALLVAKLRPTNYGRRYQRPTGRETLTTATINPASAAFVFAFPAVVVGWLLWTSGQSIANVFLFGYAAYGFPVGAVAVKREQIDDVKDREIRDFIHAVSGHVRLGTPFGTAVETVASEIDFGPLGDDIDALAFRLGLTTGTTGTDARRQALDRFVDRVGTPLAEQTVGLVTGTLDVGSDTEMAFEMLQAEVGALYHQRQQLRSAMFVYVAIGWTTALVVVGLFVAIGIFVLDDPTKLSDIATAPGLESGSEPVFEFESVIWQLYLVGQSTMVACGWFAGVAARGRYEALLHSSALVSICFLLFAGLGLI